MLAQVRVTREQPVIFGLETADVYKLAREEREQHGEGREDAVVPREGGADQDRRGRGRQRMGGMQQQSHPRKSRRRMRRRSRAWNSQDGRGGRFHAKQGVPFLVSLAPWALIRSPRVGGCRADYGRFAQLHRLPAASYLEDARRALRDGVRCSHNSLGGDIDVPDGDVRELRSCDSQLRPFGLAIREARQATGVSQEDFAEIADLHRTYIGQVEGGERNLSFTNVLRVAKASGVKPSALWARAGL